MQRTIFLDSARRRRQRIAKALVFFVAPALFVSVLFGIGYFFIG